MDILIQFIGWTGAGLILLGYFLVSNKKLGGADARYQAINLIGAIGLIISAYYSQAWPLVALNIIWAFIAIYSLVRKKK